MSDWYKQVVEQSKETSEKYLNSPIVHGDLWKTSLELEDILRDRVKEEYKHIPVGRLWKLICGNATLEH